MSTPSRSMPESNRPRQSRRLWLTAALGAAAIASGALVATSVGAHADIPPDNSLNTTTPIKHVVVLFDENESFDHLFGTYPYAANTDGPSFTAAPGTPGQPGSSQQVATELAAGLLPNTTLPSVNPNTTTATPNPNAYQPQRLSNSQALTCDENHSYGAEQSAVNGGTMNKFVESTNATCTTTGAFSSASLVMDYFDGNTVTALWNYAQNYAMSDNSWDAGFGPSTPGALNLISGNTYSGSAAVTADSDASGDSCGSGSQTMSGANVGDLLNAEGVSWGWFQGGFANCSATSQNIGGAASKDYSAHHNPFEYYASTANPNHTLPAAQSEVGHAGSANHEYDLSYFNASLTTGTMPAVSFLKAPEAQDAHPGYSDPLDEQKFLTGEINQIQQSPYWASTAIIISYDDSDGWYDHQAPVITNASSGVSGDTTICTAAKTAGVTVLQGQDGRCGPSQRLPFLVISPYAKKNYVDHTLITQPSIIRFIEDNWNLGRVDDVSSVKGSLDASAGSLLGMFDFQHPQQNEVILDSNIADRATTFGTVTATPAVTVVPPPTVSVAHSTVRFDAGAEPSQQQLIAAAGAQISSGSISVDTTGVDFTRPGSYSAWVGGSDQGVETLARAAITVEVAPTVSAAQSTVLFVVGSPPSAAHIRTAAGVTATAGAELAGPNLSGVDFGTVGEYPVTVTAMAAGFESAPLTVTVKVVAQNAVALADPDIGYALGSTPTPLQLLDASGAYLGGGLLDAPDIWAIDFQTPGVYSVALTGSVLGLPAVPATLRVHIVPPPSITVRNHLIYYARGSDPTPQQFVSDAGAAISGGSLDAPDLSGVDFAAAGDYSVVLSGNDAGVAASPARVAVAVIAPPVVTVATGEVTFAVGAHPSSADVLAAASAHIDGGSLLPVDLSTVDFARAATYQVALGGSHLGLSASPVELTIHVVAKPVITVLHASARFAAGASHSSAEIIADLGAQISSGYLNSLALGSVNFGGGGTYPLTLRGADSGVAADPIAVTVVVASNASSSTTVKTVRPTASKTLLKVADASLHGTQKPKLTVTVTATDATASGSVKLYDGSKLLKTVTLSRGKGTVTLGVLQHGTHRLKAVYAGSAKLAGSTSGVVEVTSAK